ncbi:serine hydrolase domain-containing protein [Ekhidna sp.]|uniref:serine hydrolase domain-containing protein n=1 Tax=Ekhidna sp. TaxID=2608089 RepID=UPI003CCC00C8
MKNLSLIFLLLFISCAQTKEKDSKSLLSFASPSNVGMNADSLTLIDEVVQRYVDEGKFPGAVTLIAKNGKIIYESEIGFDDSLKSEAYKKHHLFRLASMTKPITSVAVLQLVEQGKVNLDDPISKYIPAFSNIEVLDEFNPEDTTWTTIPIERPPTIHHLLTHTSGIPYAFMDPPVNGAMLLKYEIPDLTSHTDITMEEVADELGKIPLVHQPGVKMTYGLNIDVLGRVVEVASGKDLSSYINENILDPLGMDSTDFFFDDSYASMLTTLYQPDTAGSYQPLISTNPLNHEDFPVYGAKSHYSGGSGLSGTARDYFKFCQMILNDGTYNGNQVLSPESVEMMSSNQIDTLWTGKNKFGYGFVIQQSPSTIPEGTIYFGGAFSTSFWIDPENELIIIQLRQVYFSPNGWSLGNKLLKHVYSAMETKKAT